MPTHLRLVKPVDNQDICELLQETIQFMEDSSNGPDLLRHAEARARARSFRAGAIIPVEVAHVCIAAISLAAIGQVSVDRADWSVEQIDRTIEIALRHTSEVTKSHEAALIPHALMAIRKAYADRCEAVKLKAAPND